MRRLLFPSLFLLGCGLLAPALLSLAGQPARARAAARAPLTDARACKPQPPLEASLQQLAAADGVVELVYRVTPRPEAGALAFRLELPEGAELLDGTLAGSLPAGSAGTGELRARVRLPDASSARVLLHVDGALVGASGEAVSVRRALTWGRPAPAGRALTLVDAASGVAERIADAPVRHRGSVR